MGLLTDAKRRKKIIGAIARYNNVLCAASYVVGVVWFIALAYQPLNAKTYFSENALLPEVVESKFRFDNDFPADTYTGELKAELKKDKRNVPRDWVYNHFRDIGLETYIQNYTIKYPLNLARGQLVPGQNVYGILRSRRTAHTECIVLSVPFRAKSSDLPQTYAGIVMMMGLAKYFRRQPYWSKDIIFLVTDHEQIGMQAWLDGYHQISAEYIQPGELRGRSGSIQAALNLEIPDGNIRYFNVKLEGLNGQLPNLDLVNLVVRICRRQGVDIRLHNNRDIGGWEAESLAGFQRAASTMLKMMWSQATGVPTGNHGMFHRYHIEAVTLEGVRRKGRFSIEAAGRVVEGTCRSLNNLLERFHQSFFFYILPATERYISIGLYMIPFAIMVASSLIKAIALWVSNSDKKDGDDETSTSDDGGKTEKVDEGGTQEKLDKQKLEELVEEETVDEEELDDMPKGFVSILPILFSSILMGLLCFSGPDLLSSMAVPFKMNIEDGMFFGFLALFTASLLFPRMVARKTSDDKKLLFDWRLLKSLSLIFQSLVLFALSLMNISLAFFIAVVTIPPSVIVHPSNSRLSRLSQKLLLLLISPLSLLYAAAMLENLKDSDALDAGVLSLLLKSWSTLSRGLLLTMVDRYFFGSWLFALFSFTILPNWLTLWGISFCEAS